MHASATKPREDWMAFREQYTESISDSMNVPRWNSVGPIVYSASVTRDSQRSDEQERRSWFEFAQRARDRWLLENPF